MTDTPNHPNPNNPTPNKTEHLDNEALEAGNPNQKREPADPAFEGNTTPQARLAGDDHAEIKEAVAALDEEDPDGAPDLDEEPMPDPTEQRGFR